MSAARMAIHPSQSWGGLLANARQWEAFKKAFSKAKSVREGRKKPKYSGGIHAMPLLPPKGSRMSKTRLYPDDIREAVLADIRAFDACRNVRNIAIVPVNAPEAETNWAIDFIADGAARISHDCKIQIIALQNRMQREYEAIWPDQLPS